MFTNKNFTYDIILSKEVYVLDWIVANLPFLLCVVFGILLLMVEAVIPGFGVAGILGAGFTVASIILCAISFGPLATIGLTIAMGAILIIVFSLSVKSLRSGRLSKTIVLHENMHDSKAVELDTSLIGKTGVTLCELRPTGIVKIEDRRIDAISDGEFIEKGAKIYVYKVEDFKLIVKRL